MASESSDDLVNVFHLNSIFECYSRNHLCQVVKPAQATPFFLEHTKRVSSTCLILCDRNRYSVPAAYANKPVRVRVYAGELL